MEEKKKRTIFGSESGNLVGYCRLHHCSLTPRQMCLKKCLQKRCNHLMRNAHPYWVKRLKSKELRKLRKIRLEERYRAACSGGKE